MVAENENQKLSKVQTKCVAKVQTKSSNTAQEISQLNEKISERVNLRCTKIYPNSDSNFAMRDISTDLGMKMNPRLRPNDSHKSFTNSVKIKVDAVMKP